ncbi:HopJ type III effector protein [Acinetobacter marinus]|uniref:HopJ type III effector protein n=1 Tax=Acinetobacter marinus TaxID=281375 RepID=A0A1G6HIS6_9GAMM|nr:HopJ type III effector protein [Acinetobacter marinus]
MTTSLAPRIVNDLLVQLEAGTAQFADVIRLIDMHYQHTPTAFQNGEQHNTAEQNQGSAKVLSFAKLNGLDQAQTLRLFAEHYQSVLATPEGTDHQNIRQFMVNGWDGVKFEGEALVDK